MNFNWKKALPDALCILLFAVISFVYFTPAVMEGRRLDGHDHNANDGISMEINQYRDAHDGATPRWVTSIFGGMPTYQIAPSYNSTKILSGIEKAYHLWFPDYVWYIFASMLGFYILLRAFDFKQWMAALGAIVWAFSSYFFIIIAAGHIWKVITLAYIPPTIAGLVTCYRAMDVEEKKARMLKLLGGFLLTAFFGALQILGNHVQMTYYFLFPIFFMVIAYLVKAIKEKKFARWCIATGMLAVAAIIAVGINGSNLYNTYEYQKESMRGKSELVKQGGDEKNQTDSGLERDYITAWSYGIDETFTFLIPNYRGGASVPLTASETAMKKADGQFSQTGVYGAFTQYWGEQPGTSGPVYLGAIICMLFVLAMIMIPNKNPMKWALIIASLITLMLGWGKNFMPFTNLFIDHFPMYAKFRTVSSILVVVEFTVPLLAMWGLKLFVEKPNLKALYASFGFTVLLTLVLMFTGGDCISTMDRNAMNQYVGAGYFDQFTAQQILASISTMRGAMLMADGWRSIIFIVLGAAVLYWYASASKKKEGEAQSKLSTWLSVALLMLCLIDMWGVNKRYLNDDMFQAPALAGESIKKGDCENYILSTSGTGRDYRVMNMAVSTFNDNTTSAFFSSIGGYHAAKLRRYQEVIEAHITPEMSKVFAAFKSAPVDTTQMLDRQTPYPIYDLKAAKADSLFPVINMLNTRWFIVSAGEGSKVPIENNAAMGNAWFVTNVDYVNNANEELDALGKVDLHNTAVVAKNDFGFLKSKGEGEVQLTAYGADEAKYSVDSKQGGLVVFSEVYYPGWTATIDGQETEVGRANYILRAINVPAGKHEVVFSFKPKSVSVTEGIAKGMLFGLMGFVLILAFCAFKTKKEESK